MDATDQLLLSEGVCQQLGIVTYHSSLQPAEDSAPEPIDLSIVPTIRVSLIQSLRLPQSKSAIVPMRLEPSTGKTHQSLLIECSKSLEKDTGINMEEALVPATEDGLAWLIVSK